MSMWALESDAVKGRAYDGRLMRRLLPYLAPYRKAGAVFVGALFLSSAAKLAQPYLLKVAVDRHMVTGDAEGLGSLVLVFVGLVGASFAFSTLQAYLSHWIGQRVVFDLRTDLFRHLQRLPMAFFDRHPVGRLVPRVTTDVQVIQELVTAGGVALFGDILILVGAVAVMMAIDWRLALVTLSVGPLLLIATVFYRRKARDAFRQERAKLAELNAVLQENLSGMETIQAFAREDRSLERFHKAGEAHLHQTLRSIRYYALFYPTVELVGAVALGLILWYGGQGVLQGMVTLGSLVAFIAYLEKFFAPVRDLSEKYTIMQSAMASSERIFGLLDTPGEPVPKAPKPSPTRGDVRFEDVWFAYPEGEPVLRGVSFHVAPGETVALVGATGAGKSTVVKLLLRFHDAARGRIRVDGVDVRHHHPRDLRRAMALVPQELFLFTGTIEENLRLGTPDLDHEALEAVARHVHAHPFIQRLPGGYRAEVKERGSTFSTGQKQLLAFARALATDPRILILDEATSSVDPETEALIRNALATLLRDRTALIIAHRLSTVQHADRILVLHHGRVAEEGTHRELLAQGGLYRKLYDLQYRWQEQAGATIPGRALKSGPRGTIRGVEG